MTWIRKTFGNISIEKILNNLVYQNGSDKAVGAYTLPGSKTTLIDEDGNPITSLGGGSSASSGDSTYSTEQNDFTAAVTDSSYSIVLSTDSIGGDTISEENFLGGSLNIYDASTEENINIALDDFTWTVGTKTLDVTNCTNAFEFATGDKVSLSLSGPKKAYDLNQDVDKVTIENPLWNRYTDAESLVSASDIGAVDDTWIDQGAEIDCRGYNTISIWVNFTVNNSTGNQLQILRKHESGGTDEYIMEASADYQKTIGDASVKIVYDFEVDNTTPFLQIQTKATDVDTGGGTEGTVTIHIIKGYK